MNRTMRRKDRAVSSQRARQILENCEYAVFSTVNADDGSPYCIPVSPVTEGDFIYFHCAMKGQKIDNLCADSRVCLTCVGGTELVPERFTTKYESAVVCGRAELLEQPEEKRHALYLLCQKYAPSNLENFEAETAASLPRTAVCKIAIESITGKSNY